MLSPSRQTIKATQVTAGRSATSATAPAQRRGAVQSCAYSSTSAATKPHRSCVSIALWCLLWSLWLLLTPPNAQSWAFGFFFQELVFGGFAVKDWKTAQPSSPWLNLRRCAGYSSSHHLLTTSASISRASHIFLYPLGTLRLPWGRGRLERLHNSAWVSLPATSLMGWRQKKIISTCHISNCPPSPCPPRAVLECRLGHRSPLPSWGMLRSLQRQTNGKSKD